MKKSGFMMVCGGFLLLLSWGNVCAALSDQGNVVFDDVAQQYWIKNLTLFTGKTYAEQQSAIAELNAGSDYQDSRWGAWHMATSAEALVLYRDYPYQIPYFFSQTDSGAPGYAADARHWWGTYDEIEPSFLPDTWYKVMHLTFNGDLSGLYGGGMNNYIQAEATLAHGVLTGAWVTAAAVPIPGAVWLLGSGLIGLAGLRRRSSQ